MHINNSVLRRIVCFLPIMATSNDVSNGSAISPTATSNHTTNDSTETSESETESRGWFSWLPSWKPTSKEQLVEAEKSILNNLTSERVDKNVPIADGTHIRTLSMPPQETGGDTPHHPLVMVHGFGCGLAAFYKNFDHLHSKRHLYAFDVLGFGRSSRAPFGTDPVQIEDQFVESFESWRKAMGLEKFILLGHSLGAFMSTSYAMKYPERVRHLILVDTWGFVEKPNETEVRRTGRHRLLLPIAQYYVSVFSPFAVVRALGPYGPRVLGRFRADLQEKFGEEFMNYVYHCNAQVPPTGEYAFSYMQLPIAYAKNPMLNRMDSLPSNIPMSMLYGTRSWFDNSTGEKVYSMRPASFVDIHYIKGAGHHIHAEAPDIFNDVVNNICEMVDNNRDRVREGEQRDEQTAFHSHP